MQYVSGLERARAALERGSRFPAGALGEIVSKSWQRCVERGLDPRGSPLSSVIEVAELNRKREQNALLRRFAIAEMQMLHQQIAGSNFMIAFGDRDGVVLDTISDHHFADSSDGRTIIPGSLWQEQERGTNALGLAVLERAPVAIYGREHYFSCHGHLSCMAAPIFNAGGEIIGLLDASCSNEARQQHTHALVKMAAAQIENSLIFHERAELLIFAFHPRVEYLDTLSAGLMAISRDGTVHSLNRPSRALLAGLEPTVGSHFEDLFDARLGTAMDSVLGGGIVRIDDRAGSSVFMVCRQFDRGGAERAPAKPVRTSPIVPSRADLGFVCEDPALKRQMRGLEQATRLRLAVHIHGETGTGKEMMARHVHAVSARKGAFVAVNCGAIAESLFIAELFGHERGAFTNARNEGSPGLVRTADKGTLFLDEVADIPAPAQTALLRFLDSMEVRPVGGQKTAHVDVQIVSATNRDLKQAVAERRFRADLYYRLSGYDIQLPALRDRTDFAAIVLHLLHQVAPEFAITDEAIERLRLKPWPGNARELKAALQRAVIESDVDYIDENAVAIDQPDLHGTCSECRSHVLARRKCQQIRETYVSVDRNIAEVARLLGISRTTVYKHLRD